MQDWKNPYAAAVQRSVFFLRDNDARAIAHCFYSPNCIGNTAPCNAGTLWHNCKVAKFNLSVAKLNISYT
jgi:hypothetical protein